MVSELSVLIPVYNQEVHRLVHDIHTQCSLCGLSFEIRVYDDGSETEIKERNRLLNQLDHVYYLELQQNIGRSAIRNLLAREARYRYLLFLDNDNLIPHPDYIHRYQSLPEDIDIVLGGTVYSDTMPSSAHVLRWRYGREREQKSLAQRLRHPYRYFALNNTLCAREVFLRIGLDEKLRDYGYEDVVFALEAEKAGIPVLHIHNPVVHVGLDKAEEYLRKTRQAVANLQALARREQMPDDIRLLRTYRLLRRLRLLKPFLKVFSLMQKNILHNLHSPDPSLFYFDLYRLKQLVGLMGENK
jgi:glycosyltransferase involved in cell wall biosynthesis